MNRGEGFLDNRRAQMKISFGMIFSIILIIAILSFAFYAIQKFMGMQDNLVMKKFEEGIQKDIDAMYASTQGGKKVSYSVIKDVTRVCFQDDPYGNMVVYKEIKSTKSMLENIDIAKTLAPLDTNPKILCVKPKESKINLYLEKKYGDEGVTIKV